MVRALLNIVEVKPGETILGPLIGSGTTAVECQLLGINCIGIDASPLCVLQSKVKTESYQVIQIILNHKADFEDKLKSSLFNSDDLSINDAIQNITDEKVRNFFLIAKLAAISDNARHGRNFIASFQKI